MAKIIGGKYKTHEGAAKRVQFERAMNPSEYAKGYASHLYTYRVVLIDGVYRVERTIVKK